MGNGPTLYSNWNWDTAVQIGDEIYVGDSTGLYRVTGILDKGATAIASTITIPESDLGIAEMKTMVDAFVGMKGGPVTLQTFHDSTYSNSHTLSSTKSKIVTKRAKLDLGTRQRYTGVKLSSVDGTAWELDTVELDGVIHSRKINEK